MKICEKDAKNTWQALIIINKNVLQSDDTTTVSTDVKSESHKMKKNLEATTASEILKEIYMQAARNVELDAQKVHMLVVSKEQYDELSNTALTLFAGKRAVEIDGKFYDGIAGIAIALAVEGN